MAVNKIFEDDNNECQKLELYRTNYNRCYISVGLLDEDLNSGWITLSSDDLTELIAELQFIKNQIDSNE